MDKNVTNSNNKNNTANKEEGIPSVIHKYNEETIESFREAEKISKGSKI